MCVAERGWERGQEVGELLFLFPQEGPLSPEHAAGPPPGPQKDSAWGSWGHWRTSYFPISFEKCIEHAMGEAFDPLRWNRLTTGFARS